MNTVCLTWVLTTDLTQIVLKFDTPTDTLVSLSATFSSFRNREMMPNSIK